MGFLMTAFYGTCSARDIRRIRRCGVSRNHGDLTDRFAHIACACRYKLLSWNAFLSANLLSNHLCCHCIAVSGFFHHNTTTHVFCHHTNAPATITNNMLCYRVGRDGRAIDRNVSYNYKMLLYIHDCTYLI